MFFSLTKFNEISLHTFKKMNRLINKLQPGSVAKICTSGGGFKLRENVSAFRKFLFLN
jgi:hypothetical protein